MTHPCWEPSPSAAERSAVNVDLKMVSFVAQMATASRRLVCWLPRRSNTCNLMTRHLFCEESSFRALHLRHFTAHRARADRSYPRVLSRISRQDTPSQPRIDLRSHARTRASREHRVLRPPRQTLFTASSHDGRATASLPTSGASTPTPSGQAPRSDPGTPAGLRSRPQR